MLGRVYQDLYQPLLMFHPFHITDSININTLLTANPTKKDELSLLASQISTLLFDRLASNPQYAHFATEICKLVVQPCRDVDVRKAATALGVVANEKVQEAKDKASGKKKVSRQVNGF